MGIGLRCAFTTRTNVRVRVEQLDLSGDSGREECRI
jgi:hypothetical protein